MICSYFRISILYCSTHTFTIWLRDGVREGHLQRGWQGGREEERLGAAEERGGDRRGGPWHGRERRGPAYSAC